MYKIKINRRKHTIKVQHVNRRVIIRGKSKRGLTGAQGPTGPQGPMGPGAADATTTTKGILKLAGDLSGTAELPTVPGLNNKVSKNELVYNVKDHGAIGNGSTNDSPAINAVLSGGNRRVYFPAGTYLVNSYLRVYADTEIELHPDAVIMNNMSSVRVVFVNGLAGDATLTDYSGQGNIIIRGGTVDCSLLTDQSIGGQGIGFAHAENILIENMTFLNNYQGHQIEVNACKHVIIRGCHFETTVLTSPDSREFINVDSAAPGTFPTMPSYDETACQDILIDGCTFIDGDVSVGTHTLPPDPDKQNVNIRVVNCHIENMATAGITPGFWVDSVVSGNTIVDSGLYGIRVRGTRKSIISNNVITGGCTVSGIRLYSSTDTDTNKVSVTGNTIRDVTGRGINITDDNHTVVGNNIQGTGDWGMYCGFGNRSVITNNTISGFTIGFVAERLSNAIVTNNYITDYITTGMYIGYDAGDGNGAYDNLVASNRFRGDNTQTNSLYISAIGIRTTRYGNRFRDAGPISDNSDSSILYATDSESIPAIRVTSGIVDLNNYVNTGVYYFTQSATIANIPAGSNGVLQVISLNPTANGDNGRVKQLWYRFGTNGSNDFQSFVRTRDSLGAWSSWNTFAMLASPTFTGTPAAPTATAGTNTTQIATTAFVTTAANAKVVDSINDGVTTTAPSQNAVFDALALKGTFTLPALTPGSVLFSNGSTIAQDNSSLFFDDTNNRLGLSTNTPTHSLTLGSTSNGLVLYNTTDQTTNYERALLSWSSNLFAIDVSKGGSGLNRSMRLSTPGGILTITTNSASGVFNFVGSANSANSSFAQFTPTYNQSSGINNDVVINPTISQSGTAGYVALLINPTENTLGSGVKLLQDLQVGGVSKMSVDNSGNVTHADGGNIILGTVTGTRIGTSATQKLGFFNATPVVRPVLPTDFSYSISNASVDRAFNADDVTIDKLSDVVATISSDLTSVKNALKNLGLLS